MSVSECEYEPMDIDSSLNSCSAMEISYNEMIPDDTGQTNPSIEECKTRLSFSTNESKQKLKKFQIIMRPKTGRYSLFTPCFISLFFVGILISIICYKFIDYNCYLEFDPDLLRNSLISKVYGQPKAVENFIQALETNTNSNKILFLYGGTGVGKTLSVSLVLDKIINYTNIYHFTMPSFVDKFSRELNLGLIFCEQTFIVIDDLNIGDKHVKLTIKDIIEKTENLKKKVTLILIYNCDNVLNRSLACDNYFVNELQEMFNDVKASKHFIRYVPLMQESLKQCIIHELQQREIENVDIDKVMNLFNVTNDGCKGVHSKIKSLKNNFYQ
ncbi:uncharacterized protein [Battus philenor]|uniref:uncharacterized protein n=1 Tax=Battus philenor TaxID=42288 RepID=UPI0035CF18FE